MVRPIPFTILAFFPKHKMGDFKGPTVEEMVKAYEAARGAGLAKAGSGQPGCLCAH
jgi:pyruvate-formate lyase-activating enzyme